MTQYTIDKKIPIPEKQSKYPWREMEVGDSFFVEATDHDKGRLQKDLFNSSGYYARRNNAKAKFTTRQMDDGVRVWRIA